MSKPLSEFSKARRNKDGHKYRCKACCVVANREWSRTESGRESVIRTRKNYRERVYGPSLPAIPKDLWGPAFCRCEEKIGRAILASVDPWDKKAKALAGSIRYRRNGRKGGQRLGEIKTKDWDSCVRRLVVRLANLRRRPRMSEWARSIERITWSLKNRSRKLGINFG